MDRQLKYRILANCKRMSHEIEMASHAAGKKDYDGIKTYLANAHAIITALLSDLAGPSSATQGMALYPGPAETPSVLK